MLGAPVMIVLWKVVSGKTNGSGKNPSEIHEASSLSYYRNDYYKTQQRSIVRSIFDEVLECASADLTAMWHLGLAL